MATQAVSDGKIDIGRVIQRGFSTFGRQAGVLLVLALLLTAVPAIVLGLTVGRQMAAASTDPTAALSMVSSPGYWVTILVNVLCSLLLQASVVRASILDLRSERVDIASNLIEALKLLLPMIGLSILTTLIVGIGFVLLIVPGIIALLYLSVSVPVLVSERLGVTGSMSRSGELTKGTRGRIFLLFLIIGVIYIAVGMVSGLIATPMMLSGSLTVAVILQSIIGAVSSLISAVMVASLYVELRMVKENVSEQGLAAIFS